MNDPASNERELFMQLLEQESTVAREAYLDRVCAGKDDLRRRLISLLEAHGEAGDFMKGESQNLQPEHRLPATSEVPVAEGPGSVIGHYRLLQKIGEGGFGLVYMAEQKDPVKRKVALKIIKLGMDTRQVVGRFEAERQALALMDHPNIARVLDAGSTETGRPYFVMELVKGIPITEYCNRESLTTEDRIRLFMPVCLAIQHAHQKGIIHRDIKPGNVMITMHDDQPVPKVIDFGIAKAMQQELTEITVFTRFHEFIGTPAYMSPEQAQFSGLDIDTRSDIYSLGALLYELLTGSTPFNASDLLSAGHEEMRRRIREVDPAKPSTRVNTLAGEERTTVARQRGEDPERLGRALKGDLDWIVMKALEKNRSRRYDSAGALAQDLRNFLEDQPVTAAAPGFFYLFGKFARRHRTAIAFATMVLLLLVLGIVATSYQAIRASRAERQALFHLNEEHKLRMEAEIADRQATEARGMAERQAAISEAVVRFLNEDIFAGAGAGGAGNEEMTVSSLFDRARAGLSGRFAGQPLVEAAIHDAMATSLFTLGRYREAYEEIENAFQLRKRHLGPDAEDTLDSMALYAWLLHREKDYQSGLRLAQEAVDRATRSLGRSHPVTLKNMSRLAWMYYERRETRPECEGLIAETVELARQQPETSPIVFIRSLQLHGRVIKDGRGEDRLREALTYAERNLGSNHPWTINALGALAGFLYDASPKQEEAEQLNRLALQKNVRLFGQRHPNSIIFRSNLKLIYWRLERWEDALFHELKHFQLGGDPAPDHRHLLHTLNHAPLDELNSHSNNRQLNWMRTHIPPAPDWVELNFDDSDWQTGRSGGSGLVWFRGYLEITDGGDWTPVFLIRSTGDFEIWINGMPASRFPPYRSEDFQVLVASEATAESLRMGRNLIAIEGRNLDPGVEPDIQILAGPDLSETF